MLQHISRLTFSLVFSWGFICTYVRTWLLVIACARTVRVCMPVCLPEAWLQGCLHLRVELLNFVRKLRESMWHDCASLLSRLLGSGHVRPNYAFPNQTKWLLLVSISMCSSPKPQVGVHTNNAAHSVLPFKKRSAAKMWFEHKSNYFSNNSYSVITGLKIFPVFCRAVLSRFIPITSRL